MNYYLDEEFAVDFITDILEYEESSFVRDEIIYVLFQRLTVKNKSLYELFELLNLEKAINFVIEELNRGAEFSEELLLNLNKILMTDIDVSSYREEQEVKEEMNYLIDDFLSSEHDGVWFLENFMEIKPFKYRNLATAAMAYLFISLRDGDEPQLFEF